MRPGPANTKRRTPAQIFKPWIVRRPDGGCQVLFPLTELDRLLEEVVEYVRQEITTEAALVTQRYQCFRVRCSRREHVPPPMPWRRCPVCGLLFARRRSDARFCGTRCGNLFHQRRRRAHEREARKETAK